MKLKVPFVLIVLCWLFHYCETPKEKDEKTLTSTSKQVHVDTSIYTILPYDSSNHWIFEKANATSLSESEVLKIEDLLQTTISEYNNGQRNEFDSMNREHPEYELKQHNFIIDLKRYKRQYFPVVNHKGEKEVWVNCFCSTRDENWRNNFVFVFDGGNCYFNIKVNLTKQIAYELSVNGES